jgi:cysteine desulfurase
MKQIYLDNAATTQLSPAVIEKINEVNSNFFGNPSSIHSTGQDAKRIVDESRKSIASFLEVAPTEVIFTSGGSESDNLAIRGVVESVIPAKAGIQKKELDPRVKPEDDNFILPHIITSQTEHHAVLHTIEDLEKAGLIEATYLKPNSDGVISAESVKNALKENTVLVSIMLANNETGVINPIKEIAEVIRIKNQELVIMNEPKNLNSEFIIHNSKKHRVFLHTDAVQGAEFLEIKPNELNVDLLTFTAHKIHGPKGVGVLYIKKGTPIKPQITGGDHEFRLRAGTENISGVAGMAEAINEVKSQKSKVKSIELLRDKLENGILDKVPDVIVNGGGARRLPHVTNISFINAEGEAILLNLDFMGIAVSSGSACTSRSLAPSHVLSAMGVPPEKAHGTIRFSLSRYTTEEEVDRVLEVVPPIIEKLRAMSPFRADNII